MRTRHKATGTKYGQAGAAGPEQPVLTDKLGAVRTAIRALEVEGRLTPQAVVDAAKDPDSALHDRFEWDDSKAAAEFRLEQARELIRMVRVQIETDERVVSTVRYVHDPDLRAGEQGYVSVPVLLRNPESARKAVLTELTRAEAALERAEGLAEAMKVARDIAPLRRRLAKVRKKAEEE